MKNLGEKLTGSFLPLVLFAATLAEPSLAFAQRDDLNSLYGSQNIQTICARYLPVMIPDLGGGGELLFGFNTLSSKSEGQERWRRFHGVSVGGGGLSLTDADFNSYEERNASAGYIMLLIEGKRFYTTAGPVRPYLGAHFGFGFGSLWMQRDDELPDPALPGMQLLLAGAEAGMHIKLKDQTALVVAVALEARVYQFADDAYFSMPLTVNLGFSKWLGPLR